MLHSGLSHWTLGLSFHSHESFIDQKEKGKFLQKHKQNAKTETLVQKTNVYMLMVSTLTSTVDRHPTRLRQTELCTPKE